MQQLKGKTRKQIIGSLGSNYISEYGGDIWMYVIGKTWFRKEKALIIEFDENDTVINVEKVNDEE